MSQSLLTAVAGEKLEAGQAVTIERDRNGRLIAMPLRQKPDLSTVIVTDQYGQRWDKVEWMAMGGGEPGWDTAAHLTRIRLELLRALGPFARWGRGFGPYAREDGWVIATSPSKKTLTMGEIRAAERAYDDGRFPFDPPSEEL